MKKIFLSSHTNNKRRIYHIIITLMILFSCSAYAKIYLVTNNSSAGTGSFTAAIDSANNNPGRDTIYFASIPDSISLSDEVITISDDIFIDGWSSPDYAGDGIPAVWMHREYIFSSISFDARCSYFNFRGIRFTSSSSQVRFLASSSQSVENTIIQGCFFGTGPKGETAYGGLKYIIAFQYPDHNTLSKVYLIGTDGDGTDDEFEGNVIYSIYGIYILDNPAVGFPLTIRVSGNCFNVSRSGMTGLGSLGRKAIEIEVADLFLGPVGDLLIGTDRDGVSDDYEKNIFSCSEVVIHSQYGICKIDGNYFNVLPAGHKTINGSYAVMSFYNSVHINNNIFGSFSNCVGLWGCSLSSINNNYFGYMPDGKFIGASTNCIRLWSTTRSLEIKNNVISCATGGNISIATNCRDIKIQSNYIGVNPNGADSVNAGYGIYSYSAYNITIGTDGDGDRDIDEINYFGNCDTAVYFCNGNNLRAAGNYFGVTADGTLTDSSSAGLHVDCSNTSRIGTNGDGVSDIYERNIFAGYNTALILDTVSGTTVSGNYFGYMPDGSFIAANRNNISLVNCDNISTGRVVNGSESERNIISAAEENNIRGFGNIDIKIQGNYIGPDPLGSISHESEYGINLTYGQNLYIGTDGDGINDEAEGNIISGNNTNIFYRAYWDSYISGNTIGLDASGIVTPGLTKLGIHIVESNRFINIGKCFNGADYEKNIIAGADSINLLVLNSINFKLAGNYLGVLPDGITPADSARFDLSFYGASSGYNYIGTDGDGVSDSVEGNVFRNVFLESSGTFKIKGNKIGVGADGTSLLGSHSTAVAAWHCDTLIIGTDGDGVSDEYEGNIIAGSKYSGISTWYVDNISINGNYIGTDKTGLIDLGNNSNGISITGGENTKLQIGSYDTPNTIAFNDSSGISLVKNPCDLFFYGALIAGNSIYGNDDIGIDLGDDGPTLNDADDTDDGVNKLQNYPVIDSAYYTDSTLYFWYTLNSSTTSSAYPIVVDLFLADTLGQGREYLYSTSAAAPVSMAEGSFTGGYLPADYIAGTARDADNNSSEFSPSVFISGAPVLASGYLGSVTDTSAYLGSDIVSPGYPYAEYGFLLNTEDTLSWSRGTIVELDTLTGTGIRWNTISGLKPNTNYYYKAYAFNRFDTVFLPMSSFTTHPQAPLLGSATADSTNPDIAVISYNITNIGVPSAHTTGCIWDSTSVLSLAGSQLTINTAPDSAGTYIDTLKMLKPGVKYYVTPYIISSYDTVYGGQISFTAYARTPQVTTLSADTSAGDYVTVNFRLKDAGYPASLQKGTVWNSSNILTLDLHTKSIYTDTSTSVKTDTLRSLEPGTLYFYRAYSFNSLDTVFGTTFSFSAPQPLMPVFSASADTISFGGVFSGRSGTRNIAIRNTGRAALEISSISHHDTGYTCSHSGPVTINSGSSINVTVTFSPSFNGEIVDSLVITHNAGTDVIYLTGTGIVYPSSYSLTHSITFPVYDRPSDYGSADYRMFGIPGNSGEPAGSFLPGTQGEDWELYLDNGETGTPEDYYVKYDGSSGFTADAGRAFWLIYKGSFSLDSISVSTAELDSAGNIAVMLAPGVFNLITNPLIVPVNWSEVQQLNGFTQPIVEWDGSSLVNAAVLQPYDGYLFDNRSANIDTLLIRYPGTGTLPKSGTTESSTSAWYIYPELYSGKFSDKTVRLGVNSSARNGYCRYDWHKARVFAELPAVYFSRPQFDPDYPNFASDVRRTMTRVESWHFTVEIKDRKPGRIIFRGIDGVPENSALYLFDVSTFTGYNLRKNNVYEFTPHLHKTDMMLFAGDEKEILEEIEKLMPKSYALGNNYPNPFNPETRIPVTVPEPSDVQLIIYNILGEKIKTIYHGMLPAGQHYFRWDGRNDAGVRLSSGIYFARMITDKAKFTHKMMLTK